MTRIYRAITLLAFATSAATAKEPERSSWIRITKEYNRESYSEYNMDCKSVMERFLFNGFNADIEFSIPGMWQQRSGFRIFKDEECDEYVFERKAIVNYDKDISSVRKSHPSAILEECKRGKDYYSLSTAVETIRWPISDSLRNTIYSALYSLINNYRIKGEMEGILDGYVVTFRIVVGDELWGLTAHCPSGIIYDMYRIFRQLNDETQKGPINEQKYFKLLDGLEL